MTCKARYEGGQMVCNRCGYVWDLDDERPECNPLPDEQQWLDIPVFLRRSHEQHELDLTHDEKSAISVKVMNDIREILK
jgi:hypothetical protein